MKIIGRKFEMTKLLAALRLKKNILIEGPVGVGKTFLVQAVLQQEKKSYERVDGDTRYTEQKLTGWFDPPIVIKKGFNSSSFIEGPLVQAMKKGQILFINELNRMPEAVQNILLPAMDEKKIALPKIGEVKAKEGFLIIATQNPKAFIATHTLSEALMDRFEMIHIEYQSEEEELEILSMHTTLKKEQQRKVLLIVRATRNHPAIRRGASIRSAISICQLIEGGLSFEEACVMGLTSRIELVSSDESGNEILLSLMQSDQQSLEKKKPISAGLKSFLPA